MSGVVRQHAFEETTAGLIFRAMFIAIGLAAAMLVLPSPAGSFQAETLSDTQKKELKKAFAVVRAKRKGPFAKNTCVCTDGRSAPVLSKTGEIRNICGAKTLFCAAFKADWGKDLEKQRVYVGNLFSRDLHDWDRFTNHHDLVRGIILERFLIDTQPKHKLAEVRGYGGLSGAEYEVEAQPKFYERYLTLDSYNDFRHFLLAYELQKRHFARGDFGKMQEVRNMASRIQARDKKFKPLRNAVHNQVSASLIPLLVADRDKRPAGKTRKMVDELIAEIKKLTSLTDDAIRPQLAEIENAEALTRLTALLDQPAGDDIGAIASLAAVMAAVRNMVAERQVAVADARRLIDLNITVAAVLQSRGSALIEGAGLKTVDQHLRFMKALADASYGVGLLSSRERTAASANFDALLAQPQLERDEFLRRLKNAERVVEWAQNSAVLAFSEVWAQWVYLMPAVVRLPDDILRGSPLLMFAQVHQRLNDALTGQFAVRHEVFGKEYAGGLRALNPGLAIGKLRLNPKTGTYSRQEVLALETTPEDLQPAAGIMTQGEGNVVSHVQLLARALGIPNAVTATEPFDAMEARADAEVFYAVTPGGKIVLKEAETMTEREKTVLAEFTANAKRTDEGDLGGGSNKLHIDKNALDLSINEPIQLTWVRVQDSGIRVGPKAAFLGELTHLFPDNVSRGLVLPFGVYYAHYQRAKVAIPNDLKGKRIAKAGEPLPEFVKKTYAKFFGEMVAAGTPEEKLSKWIKPRLAIIEESIRREPLDQAIKQGIQTELDALGLLQPDDKTQTVGCFVRSDTNVEDLENFNGAGLNLTIFNLRSLEDIYAGIKEVWASPFRYRSFSWRQTLIDDPEWVLPSVIVMEAVSSEKSGVAVTADINTGDPDKILIATSEGVGGAVDGTPAETLLWSEAGVELITMFKSPTRRLLKPGGGVEIVPSTGLEHVLDESEVGALVAAAQKIEKTLEPTLSAAGKARPWDIEFGFANGKLWLFQSRPFIGSDEIANLPALGMLDEPGGETAATISLQDVVR